MIKKFTLFIVCVFITLPCYAEGLTTQQAEQLQLAGFKTGMTESEVIKVFSDQYNAKQDQLDISIQKAVAMTGDIKGYRFSIKRYRFNINNDEQLLIQLEDNIQLKPIQKVVFNINKVVKNTPEKVQSIYTELSAKYGQETFTNFSGDKLWCHLNKGSCKGGNILSLSTMVEGKIYISLTTDQYRQAKLK